MKKTLRELFKSLRPMDAEKRGWLAMAEPFLEADDMAQLRDYVRMDRCFATIESFRTSPSLFTDERWPRFKSHRDGDEMHAFIARVNETIAKGAAERAFRAFAPHALDRIAAAIAPNIVGMASEKRAAAMQLFANDPVHVLLIGDPGTGKTDILRGLHAIAPIGSFGLGSGVSGVGLSAAAKGDEVIKGLLPLADGGLACIDELNLIKAKDMAALYNAMEKGFITYDKGTRHETLSAKVRVCASANPTEQAFIGKSAEVLRKQMPFGDALISRFHLIFLVRKPTGKEFEEIAKRIVKGERREISKDDAAFLKAYAARAQEIGVSLSAERELAIVEFVKELKADEKRFIAEVGPRTVVGIVRIAKALARAHLATSVERVHLEEAFAIVRHANYVRREDE